ncbi:MULTISPECIES: helix-turn-helix transcriptional regulator [Cupriavidus]|uniref:Transcription regulator protein, luxR family n=1 Tax=Cupriavidus taiwanensis TaxID=164546 RepID=A0A375D8C0_9BURK|nr:MULTISPECIES: helix-turn-helix transcriptional regulator [Cupriavidus]MEC3768370.1 helix-turn-helix transcriptional regulator [Cupriavidus sp. SS-3]SOY95189.1 putative transcription regulator protein, luxR family [Cupriavidus taiwanensis]SOY99146.1 putative transcription regulator protein, luxR family [Cupriavidus taiwanensis]SPD67094.1 putative transcription regulator protein, luxR family [Cupriavidus taiwanensis]
MGEHPTTDEDFHRLVDSIYESALDVAAMPAALDLFSRYTCTVSPRYLIWDKLAGHARLGVTPHGCFTTGATLPDCLPGPLDWSGHGAGHAPLDAAPLCCGGAAAAAPPLACRELEQGIRLVENAEVCVLMSGTNAGSISAGQRERRLSHVMPHWVRAARMQQRNFELSGLASLGLAGLDTLDFGVMVLQADLRVRYANSWAEALVQADSHLSLQDGVLRAHSDTLQAVLRKLLDGAMRGRGADAASGSWMHITSGGQPVPIIVTPLVSRQPVEGPWQLPAAMLLLGNSESRSVLDAGVLTSLFGLSRKESIIAIRLAAGETLNEIAEREFLSPHTVRVHIRDTLRKTGTHRQSELVRLLHLLPGVNLERAGVTSAVRPRAPRPRAA